MVFERLDGALLGIWGTAADDVFAVGSDPLDGLGPYALHYDGTAWTRLATGLAEGTLWWAHTDGQLAHFSGTRGVVLRHAVGSTTVESLPSPTTATLYGVYAFGPDDVWAVGGDPQAVTAVVLHTEGSVLVDVTPPEAAGLVLYKVWGPAPDDLWLVGDGGAALHWDGATFTRVEVDATLFTVHGRGELAVAVGGNLSGAIRELAGGAWHDATPAGVVPQLNGTFVSEAGEAVAVGIDHAVWLRDGEAWRADERAPEGRESLHSVYVDPEGGIWAVGGEILVEPFRSGTMVHRGTAVSGEFP